MRKGLEALAVAAVLAMSWISISQLRAASASASVSIHIERPDDRAGGPADSFRAADQPARVSLAAARPAPAPGMAQSTVTVRRRGHDTVLHTRTPEI
jgi:hypothetical protein